MTLLASVKPELRFKLRGDPWHPETPYSTEKMVDEEPRGKGRSGYWDIFQLLVEKAEDICLVTFTAPRVEQSPVDRENERIWSVERIKDIIRSRDSEQIAVLEDDLYDRLNGQEDIFSHIANDPQELINVRAMAARLFIATVFRLGSSGAHLQALADPLSRHRSPLIRLGVLLGYSDAGNMECVRKFLADPHPAVAEQALEILEDAQ